MRILMIGDVIGKPGRLAVSSLLPDLRCEYEIDMVVANAENVAGGKGVTPVTAEELMDAGVDVMTSGNHIWAQKDIFPLLDDGMPILRPLNYSPYVIGRGYLLWKQVMVVNLAGRVFMGNADCPFRAMDELLSKTDDNVRLIIVDFHAEATSEKNALGRYLDGRVSAVVGTHTHVGTIDACILPKGTAYVTDVGMTGPKESVIGDDVENVIQRFLTQMPHRLQVAKKGRLIFNSVLLDLDETMGRAINISRLDREID